MNPPPSRHRQQLNEGDEEHPERKLPIQRVAVQRVHGMELQKNEASERGDA